MGKLKKLVMGIVALLIIIAGGRMAFGVVGHLLYEQKGQAMVKALDADGWYQNAQSGYAKLTDDEKVAYGMMKEKTEAYDNEVDLSACQLSVDGLNRVWIAFEQDNPQYYWFDAYTYEYNQNTEIVSKITLNYFYDASQRDVRQAQIDARVADFKAGITEDMDDYSKVKSAHDYVITNTQYDLSSEDNQNVCSVLLGGRSVCAGYARSFQYLLHEIGIFSTTVSGDAQGRGAHAWNLVQMDGDYYYVDCTWDDPSFSESDGRTGAYVEYTFFGLTTADLLLSHTIDAPLGDYVLCEATKDNYFVREGRLYNLADGEETARFQRDVREALLAGVPQFSARFTDYSMVEEALGLVEGSLTPGSSISYNKNDDLNVLTLLR